MRILIKGLMIDLCTHGYRFFTEQLFRRNLSNFGKPVMITFRRDIVQFTPDLICQYGSLALLYHIQTELKFHLFVWGQRRKIHKLAP